MSDQDLRPHRDDVEEGVDELKQTIERIPPKEFAKQFVKEFNDDAIPDVAAGVAYRFVFAVPPMIIFFVTLAALSGHVTDVDVAGKLTTLIRDRAPTQVQELLLNLVDSAIAEVSGGLASFGVITSAAIALWSGSNGAATLMRAFNRAYGVPENRGMVTTRVISIAITIGAALSIIIALVMFVFGREIGALVADWLSLGHTFDTVWNLLRWPLAVLFITILLAMLYQFGPNVKQRFMLISPGSVAATVIWLAVVLLFKLYVTLANPGSAYGAVGSLVILLFFFYLTALAFLIGAEINAILHRHYNPVTHRVPVIITPEIREAMSMSTSSVKAKSKRGSGLAAKLGTIIGSLIVAMAAKQVEKRTGQKASKPKASTTTRKKATTAKKKSTTAAKKSTTAAKKKTTTARKTATKKGKKVTSTVRKLLPGVKS